MSEPTMWIADTVERAPDEPALVLDLDGYEGPIDLLLSLARDQKVDLAKLSILALADQYLAFIAAQRRSVAHSSDKARRLLGYTAPVSYDEGLSLTEAWLREARILDANAVVRRG